MKTFLLFGLFLVCAFNTVYAQKIEIKEITVKDHTYKVRTRESEEGDRSIWIERSTDSLRNLEPGYQWAESMDIDFDREKIKQLIREYFLPFIKQFGINLEKESIGTVSIFDLNGNLREFAIDFPEKLNIPMTVVDDLFNAVLSSGIKCTFKKDHPGLKNARFVYCSATFFLKKLLNE